MSAIQPLPAGIESHLCDRRAHPADASAKDGVRRIQTHISWVFLTGDRVYKLRKAVDHGFIRFGARGERNLDCLREVALNRRLAPDVYLGVAPVREEGGGFRVGPVAEALSAADEEHVVVMRRLAHGRDAASLLEQGALVSRHVDAIARRVARFHAAYRLARPAPFAPDEWLARVSAPVETNFELLSRASAIDVAPLARLLRRTREYLVEHGDDFERRRVEGWLVEGHGDLHLQHVWFERDAAAPLMIDCVEFQEGLRLIDGASDVAFLAMDLEFRGAEALASRLLGCYAREAADVRLYEVVDYYRSYRAAVRAKVDALTADDPGIPAAERRAAAERARRYLDLAARSLDRGVG